MSPAQLCVSHARARVPRRACLVWRQERGRLTTAAQVPAVNVAALAANKDSLVQGSAAAPQSRASGASCYAASARLVVIRERQRHQRPRGAWRAQHGARAQSAARVPQQHLRSARASARGARATHRALAAETRLARVASGKHFAAVGVERCDICEAACGRGASARGAQGARRLPRTRGAAEGRPWHPDALHATRTSAREQRPCAARVTRAARAPARRPAGPLWARRRRCPGRTGAHLRPRRTPSRAGPGSCDSSAQRPPGARFPAAGWASRS